MYIHIYMCIQKGKRQTPNLPRQIQISDLKLLTLHSEPHPSGEHHQTPQGYLARKKPPPRRTVQ